MPSVIYIQRFAYSNTPGNLFPTFFENVNKISTQGVLYILLFFKKYQNINNRTRVTLRFS